MAFVSRRLSSRTQPELDLDLPPSHCPDARLFAKALARRVAVPITRQYSRMILTVVPFGWELRSSRTETPLIYRTLTDGIKVNWGVPPETPIPFIAAVLSVIEEMLGSQQRWRIQKRGKLGNRIGLFRYTMDSSEVAADPKIIVPDVIPVEDRPFVAFDPLVSSILDARYAARTPQGVARDWIGEMREHYRREGKEP